MNRDELLKFMKGKITEYYYEILEIWTKSREYKFLLFKRKFDVEPTIASINKGYIITAKSFDYIMVYSE
jgi:hypothetical protein